MYDLGDINEISRKKYGVHIERMDGRNGLEYDIHNDQQYRIYLRTDTKESGTASINIKISL